jgi:hypothetical protein
MAEIFGFIIKRKKLPDLPAIAPVVSDDGAVNVRSSGPSNYAVFVDLDGTVRSESELINKYREMAEHPEVETAVDDITNEAIVLDDDKPITEIDLEQLMISDNIKEAIEQEFKNIQLLYEYNDHAFELFKRWYVDGRLYFQIVIDPKNSKDGIQQLRYIDPRKIRKIREVSGKIDPRTQAPLPETINEYYLYNERGFSSQGSGTTPLGNPGNVSAVKISKDSIIHCTSGLTSVKGDTVFSYLHKAIKPLNMLRSLEDSLVIYRISRAPERRIFYIDVGNLPKMKAEEYLRDIMVKFKNRVVYDSATGEIRDDRKFMTMLEDFWLPRRDGGRGTQIETLPGGQNLDQIDDIIFFQRKLFRSLQVPITRLDPEAMFNYGRENEITRDEVKFSKFIQRIRLKFNDLHTKTLGVQLQLKNIVTPEEWDYIKQYIKYKYANDGYFEELKDAQILQERANLAAMMAPFTNRYYSHTWIRKNIFKQTDEDIKEQDVIVKQQFHDPILNPPDPEIVGMADGSVPPPKKPMGK